MQTSNTTPAFIYKLIDDLLLVFFYISEFEHFCTKLVTIKTFNLFVNYCMCVIVWILMDEIFICSVWQTFVASRPTEPQSLLQQPQPSPSSSPQPELQPSWCGSTSHFNGTRPHQQAASSSPAAAAVCTPDTQHPLQQYRGGRLLPSSSLPVHVAQKP